MKRRVLYLSYDGLTDPLGQSQVLPYIAGLAKLGYDFSVISFEKKNSFETRKAEIESTCSENQIEWIPLWYRKYPPIFSTVYNIFELWREVKSVNRKAVVQVIHCRSYITALIGLRAKSKWGAKFIFDMRGFWADERVDGGLWNLKNPLFYLIYKYFKSKERDFFVHADAIITLTHTSKNILLHDFGVTQQKITVIHCSVDLNLFDKNSIQEDRKNQLGAELGIPAKDFVLLYLGSIGTWYMLEEMFTFFKALNQENRNSSFLIVTTDSQKAITEAALANGVDLEKIFIAKSERKNVPLYISLANAGIIFIKPSFSKQASFPTKLGEILGMGLPVVANTSVGDNDLLFSSADLGILLKDFNIEHYRQAAQQLLNFKGSSNLNSFVMENFSLEKGIESYNKVYSTLIR